MSSKSAQKNKQVHINVVQPWIREFYSLRMKQIEGFKKKKKKGLVVKVIHNYLSGLGEKTTLPCRGQTQELHDISF